MVCELLLNKAVTKAGNYAFLSLTYLDSSQKLYHHHQFHRHHHHLLQFHLHHAAEPLSLIDENVALCPVHYQESFRLLQHHPVFFFKGKILVIFITS